MNVCKYSYNYVYQVHNFEQKNTVECLLYDCKLLKCKHRENVLFFSNGGGEIVSPLFDFEDEYFEQSCTGEKSEEYLNIWQIEYRENKNFNTHTWVFKISAKKKLSKIDVDDGKDFVTKVLEQILERGKRHVFSSNKVEFYRFH